MRAWVYQKPAMLKKHGPDLASWCVGWYVNGKRKSESCGPGKAGKKLAMKLAEKRHAELITGSYEDKTNKNWSDFMAEYRAKAMAGMLSRTRETAEFAVQHFERIIKPAKMQGITTLTLADYVAKRRVEPRRKNGPVVSPATVNRELRTLRAILRKAHRWDYLPKLPEFEFLKEPQKLPTYITPEDFAKLYKACDQATMPSDLSYPASDWWRGLLMMAYLTGWRVGQLLAVRREDVDLESGVAITRAKDNKGKRDQKVPLHPVVIQHLRRLASFDPVMFPLNQNRRALYEEFARLQKAAGVCPLEKKRFGFHDLRRAFASLNADKMTPDALQLLMQHRDYTTTQRYINLARQLNPAVQNLFVPNVAIPAV